MRGSQCTSLGKLKARREGENDGQILAVRSGPAAWEPGRKEVPTVVNQTYSAFVGS